ncbi:MAG: hypothetical protein IT338_10330 [Thermomicrobiales bacterium]|nr:hypothetical protein [Thermomicrobiales bacterium]
MQDFETLPPRPDEIRSVGLVLASRVTAALTATLILAMAVLAGQGWFTGQIGLIRVHGMVGGLALLAAAVLAALAFVDWRRSGEGMARLGLAVALLALMFGQTALGFSGRTVATVAALHIPNGVLIAMVASALLALASRPHVVLGR